MRFQDISVWLLQHRAAVGCLLVLQTACTNTEVEQASLNASLFGRWAVGTRTAGWHPCDSQIEFFEDATYVDEYACPLDEESFGIQTLRGKWSSHDISLTIEPLESSCPTKQYKLTTFDLLYTGAGARILMSELGAVSIDPIEDHQMPRDFWSLKRRDGCFAPDMTFSEDPIQPL